MKKINQRITKEELKKLKLSEAIDKLSIEEKEDLKYHRNRKYNHQKQFDRWSIQYYMHWIKRYFKKKHMFLIVMKLRTGGYELFTTATSGKQFQRYGNLYFLDQDMAKPEYHSKMNILFYHQDISCPYTIDIDTGKLLSDAEVGNKDIVKALNPASLRGFIASKVIEKILEGQQISNEIKKLKMIVIINVIISGVLLIITAKGQGII